MQIEETVIHRGEGRGGRIIIIHIIRKPNSITVLLFVQNIAKFSKA